MPHSRFRCRWGATATFRTTPPPMACIRLALAAAPLSAPAPREKVGMHVAVVHSQLGFGFERGDPPSRPRVLPAQQRPGNGASRERIGSWGL
jgi:hypothetical protein